MLLFSSKYEFLSFTSGLKINLLGEIGLFTLHHCCFSCSLDYFKSYSRLHSLQFYGSYASDAFKSYSRLHSLQFYGSYASDAFKKREISSSTSCRVKSYTIDRHILFNCLMSQQKCNRNLNIILLQIFRKQWERLRCKVCKSTEPKNQVEQCSYTNT